MCTTTWQEEVWAFVYGACLLGRQLAEVCLFGGYLFQLSLIPPAHLNTTRRNCRFRLSGRYFILCATMRFYILCFPPIRAVRNRSILPASILYSMGS
ncbi:hypothetical protein BD309DRAFT_51544 [Dichomitus squalens]|nr:hypothetical protein BD309DRAFT_51544 [Dichomitus squalens]